MSVQTTYKYNFDDVEYAARRNWESIVKALAIPSFDWDLAIKKAPNQVPCPLTGGKTRFRLMKNFNETGAAYSNSEGKLSNGFYLLAWLNNWSLGKTLYEIGDFLHCESNSDRKTRKTNTVRIERKVESTKPVVNLYAVEEIKKLHGESRPVTKGDPVDLYLINRKIDLETFPACMRFHPALEYWDDELDDNGYPVMVNNKRVRKLLGKFPGLLMQWRNQDGKTVNMHRYYLTDDGRKADVPEFRKQMMPYMDGGTAGASFHLFPATEEMGVCEGMETGYGAFLGNGLPIWACGNAFLLSAIRLPAFVKKVHIFADKDRSGTGQNAAIELQERLILVEKREAIIHLPKGSIARDEKSLDWWDIWNNKGREGFKF